MYKQFTTCSGAFFFSVDGGWWRDGGGKVRCEWKHWPNQPEPMSPVSVDLLVSGFSSVHLKPAVSHCKTGTDTCMIPVCRTGEDSLIHSIWTVTFTSVTSSVLQNNRSAYFLFLWSILVLMAALCDLHRLHEQREKLKHELMEVEKKNELCNIYISGIKLAIFLRAPHSKLVLLFKVTCMTVDGLIGCFREHWTFDLLLQGSVTDNEPSMQSISFTVHAFG